jgi:hypothetical protein
LPICVYRHLSIGILLPPTVKVALGVAPEPDPGPSPAPTINLENDDDFDYRLEKPKPTKKAEPAKASTWSKVGKGGLDLGSASAMWGNSRESRESRAFGSLGYKSKMQTYVKRPYYTAGLRLEKFVSDSFTKGFKQAASQLADMPYNLTTVVGFMNTWGTHSK